MATQSIIVYRNPAEEAMWNMAMSGDFVPFMVAVVVFGAVFVAYTNYATKKFYFKTKRPQYANQFMPWIVAGVAAAATVKLMWI
jgi:hypothetical protein